MDEPLRAQLQHLPRIHNCLFKYRVPGKSDHLLLKSSKIIILSLNNMRVYSSSQAQRSPHLSSKQHLVVMFLLDAIRSEKPSVSTGHADQARDSLVSSAAVHQAYQLRKPIKIDLAIFTSDHRFFDETSDIHMAHISTIHFEPQQIEVQHYDPETLRFNNGWSNIITHRLVPHFWPLIPLVSTQARSKSR